LVISKKKQSERRADPRRTAEIPVSFEIKGSRTTGMTFDLSRGGLFVRTTRPPDAGSIITVRLSPRNRATTIVLRGKVVHTRESPGAHVPSLSGGFAVRVLEAAEEYYELLAQIRRRSTDRIR
jgi:hypothetical protein